MFVRRSFLIAGRTHHEHSTNPTRIFTNHYERLRMQHGQTQTFLNFTRISPIIWRIVRNVIRIRSRMNKNKQELTSHQYELIGIPYDCYTNISRLCTNMSRTLRLATIVFTFPSKRKSFRNFRMRYGNDMVCKLSLRKLYFCKICINKQLLPLSVTPER